MKQKISKVLLVLSYITAAILAFFAVLAVYDWFAISQDDFYFFWSAMDTNAVCLIWTSVIGIALGLPVYILYFKDTENTKNKIKARNMLSIFLFVLMVAIVLYFSPIEMPNTFDDIL